MKLAKGNFGSRGNVWTVAKNTVEKGLQYAYAHRQLKKRTFRSLWITRINAAVRAYGMTYSEFIGKVNAKGIAINRKVMADLAMNEPKAFEAIVKAVKEPVDAIRRRCRRMSGSCGRVAVRFVRSSRTATSSGVSVVWPTPRSIFSARNPNEATRCAECFPTEGKRTDTTGNELSPLLFRPLANAPVLILDFHPPASGIPFTP